MAQRRERVEYDAVEEVCGLRNMFCNPAYIVYLSVEMEENNT
jgi:hypothetical protein